ncbi:MAG: glycosyl hydrolase [Eubacteriales bacterium]|nr:glycosyl hydrolase [Eubacteriales bacterium]
MKGRKSYLTKKFLAAMVTCSMSMSCIPGMVVQAAENTDTAAAESTDTVSAEGANNTSAESTNSVPAETVLEKLLNPDVTAKPMARMWMADGGYGYALSEDPDAEYTESELDMMASTIKEMYDAGFGGVELTIIADITDIEEIDSYNMGFGSKAMVYTLMEALNTANNENENCRLEFEDEDFDGFIIDITVTAHWPPVLNTVDPNDDAQQQQASTTIQHMEVSDLFELDEEGNPTGVKTGEKLKLELPSQRLYSQGAAAPFYFADKLVSVSLGKVEETEVEETDFLGNVSKVKKYNGTYESFDGVEWEQGEVIASAGVPGYAYTAKDSEEKVSVSGKDIILIDGSWGKRYLSENLELMDVEVEETNNWTGTTSMVTHTYAMPAQGISVMKDEDGDGTPEAELDEETVRNLLNPTADGGILPGLDADYCLVKDGETVEVLTQGTIVYPINNLEANWGKEVREGDEDYEKYVGADGTNVFAERENDVQYDYSVNVDDILAYCLSQLGVEYTDTSEAAMENYDAVAELLSEISLLPVYRQGSGQIQSGGSKILMYPTYFALDYFNEDGADALMDYWENHILNVADERIAGGRSMQELMAKNAEMTGVSALFEDSIEASYTTNAFTNNFIQEADKILGYDVSAYLPAMIGDIIFVSEEDGDKEYHFDEDYNLVMGSLYETNHASKLVAWAKEKIGYNYRCQAYVLSGLDVVNAALTIGIPEADNAGSGDGIRTLGTATSLKNDSFDGKEILSNEALTFGTNIQSQTVLSYVMSRLNSDASDGISRIVLHGSPAKRAYSGYASAWPGLDWGFAGYGQRQTWWDDYPEVFTEYITAVQSLLQNGDTRNDFAVLTDKSKSFSLSKGDTFFRFVNEGYNYNILTEDTISRGNLALTTDAYGDMILADADSIENGNDLGACYKALVLDDVNCISLEAVNYIKEWAEAGFPVFILNSEENAEFREYGTGMGGDDSAQVDETLKHLAENYENVYDLSELVNAFDIDNTRSSYRVNHEFAANLTTWSSDVQEAIIDTMEDNYLSMGTYIRYDAGYPYNCYDMEAYGGTAASFWETASEIDTGDLVKGLHSTTKFDSDTGSYYYFLYNDTGEGATNQMPGLDVGVDITTEVVMTGSTPYAYEIDPYNGTVKPLENYTAEQIGDNLYKITYEATVLRNDTAILAVKGMDDNSEAFPEIEEVETYTSTETKAELTLDGWKLDLEMYSPVYEKDYQEWKAQQTEDGDSSVQEYLNQHKDVDPTASTKTCIAISDNVLGNWKNFDWNTLDGQYNISSLYGSVEKENLEDAVIGNGTYTTTLTLTEDQIGDFNELVIDHNVDMISAVMVNGTRYNPNQITSKVKVDASDLKAGDNEITVVISSTTLGKNASGNAYDTGLNGVTFLSSAKVK